MQFDSDILSEIIIYACDKCGPSNVGAVKLHKIAYYCDMVHFAQHGAPMMGAHYKKRPFGPTCEQLKVTLDRLQSAGDLTSEIVDYFGYEKKQFTPNRKPNVPRFTASQKALIDEVVDFVCIQNTAKTISDFSHNRAWEIAEYGDEIPYHSVFLIYPTEVSQEAFDWARGEADKIEAAEQDNSSMEFVDFATFRSRISA